MVKETMLEHKIGLIDHIPKGEGRVFTVGNHDVAVFHLRSGVVHAVQAECPHRQGPLADGLVGGTTVMCPFHSKKFDLATGAELSGECSLAVYPVRVSELGEILLTV